MRFINFKSFLSLLVMTAMTFAATAQFDDLYYDPNNDTDYNYDITSDDDDYDVTYSEDEDNSYYEDDYDDYSYTRRIKRFRRNNCSRNYYSTVYYVDESDLWMDPYYSTRYGNSVIVSIGTFGHRYNRWGGYGYSPYFTHYDYGYASFHNRHHFNNYNIGWYNPYRRYYNPYSFIGGYGYYGYPNYGYGYHNNNGYNGNGWSNPNFKDNKPKNPKGKYFGSRGGKTGTTSTNGRTGSPRLQGDGTGEIAPRSVRKSVRDRRGVRGGDTKPSSDRTISKRVTKRTQTREKRNRKSSIYSGQRSSRRNYRSSRGNSSTRTNRGYRSARQNYTPRNNNRSTNTYRSNSSRKSSSRNINNSSNRSSNKRSISRNSSSRRNG